ncbi:MAG: hypothetical protein Q4A16_05930 [Lautropia sp.]|nr:hypothetical protein [Lautropia sp.]
MADTKRKTAGLRHGVMSLAGCGALMALPSVHAADYITTLGVLGQSEFRTLSQDLGSGVSFKGVVPAESLGVLGFDISASATGMKVPNRDLWRRASGGSSVDQWIAMGGIRAHKGLPGGVDIGAFYNTSSNNVGVWGAEARWAFIRGNAVLPAVAVRGSYSALTGVDQLKLNTTGIDLSISKGILMFTPYAGIGKVWVRSTPEGVPGLQRESFSMNKAFAGININLGINLAAEVDRTGDVTSYSVKTGIRF